MTLANRISFHRKKLGWTQEELAQELDVSRQSVSKWESGQSQPDLNKIIKMSELFNISIDYLLKGTNESTQNTNETFSKIGHELDNIITNIKSKETGEQVDIDSNYAKNYLETYELESKNIANAISISMLALALVIINSNNNFDSIIIIIFGIVFLILTTIALFLFVKSDIHLSKYRKILNNNIELQELFKSQVNTKYEKLEKKLSKRLICATLMLTIIIIIFLISVISLTDKNVVRILPILIICASITINIIVRVKMVKYSYIMLLQPKNSINKKTNLIKQLCWTIITLSFLMYSFSTNDWRRSWIIFPIFIVISKITDFVISLSKNKNKY